MRAVALEAGRYRQTEIPVPVPAAGQVLIAVRYAGVNRIDLLQTQGRYPLPDGNPSIPGLEIAGDIIAAGPDVAGFAPGDRVCALVTQGGFAEYALAEAGLTLPVPDRLGYDVMACLPEACFTAWISLVWQARLMPGETILIHGGAGGVGLVAVQIARLLGARVAATAGSPEKCRAAEQAGAECVIAYKESDFALRVKDWTGGKGVDVILDCVGGDYVQRNLDALATGGRLAMIAFQNGAKLSLNLGPLLLKRLQISGSTLRTRPLAEKEKLALELRERIWPELANGAIRPVIDRVYALQDAEKALIRMQEGLNIGKILLKL